ncbi:hypothetical protein HZI30_08870 [Serratia fonticola]|uniref:hypothetical protein n=1 Tax=Serratia fonticola TaxID=47917 RepID=UPI0015C614A7|nr:hypothetical protein [Serratia fonticola]NXZ87043.1 hypothetical protein [Serratia fonticola]
MAFIGKDQVELFRRIEALEAAFMSSLACISISLPSVKKDVINNLRFWAEQNKDNDCAPAAFNALADKIEQTEFKVRD